MEFEFDPHKAAINFTKHGVRFDEAISCLLDPQALVREDVDAYGELRLVLVGMSAQARLLTVVYTLRGDIPRIISARKSTAKERMQYGY